MLSISPAAPGDADVLAMCAELTAWTSRIYPDDEADASPHLPPRADVHFVVARRDDEAVACCGVQEYGPGVHELKRMFVRPEARGHGTARAILAAAEELARARGAHTLLLETGERLTAAVGLYTSAGFVRVPNYPPYEDAPLSLCFAKPLA
ncbi:GNAT family N-acetyltransferase [Streptomycetaceae bacterium NBC_01309]